MNSQFTSKKDSNSIEFVNSIMLLVTQHLMELIDRRKEINEEIFEATAFILDENKNALDALVALGEEHFTSSLLIGRYVLENTVNLIYIYKQDSERRALNYRSFSNKKHLKRFDEYLDYTGAEELKAKIIARASLHKPRGNKSNHCDGLSVKEVMEDIGMGGLYEDWYGRLSGYVHPQYKGKTDIKEDRPYINFLKQLLFKDLLVVVLEGLKSINEKYDLLEGVVKIYDYPKDGATLFFSINNKAMKRGANKTT